MIYVAYCSAATELLSSDDLVGLLKTCRVNNERDNITGMLLYREGSFMQVIEGEEAAVKQTYSRILADPRHRNIIKLTQATITERSFGEWSMGFRDVSALTGSEIDAFSTFLLEPFDAGHYGTEGKALKLLRSFRKLVP